MPVRDAGTSGSVGACCRGRGPVETWLLAHVTCACDFEVHHPSLWEYDVMIDDQILNRFQVRCPMGATTGAVRRNDPWCGTVVGGDIASVYMYITSSLRGSQWLFAIQVLCALCCPYLTASGHRLKHSFGSSVIAISLYWGLKSIDSR